jgi:putative membrane protein
MKEEMNMKHPTIKPFKLTSIALAAVLSGGLTTASLVGLAISSSTPASAEIQSQPRAPLTPEFKQDAAFFFALQIATGHLALEKSQSPAIKEFAQRMVSEHTEHLGELIVRTGIRPDIEVAATAIPGGFVSPDQAAAFQQLKDAQGAEFDRKYVDLQVDAHRRVLVLFDDYAKYGDDWYMTEFAGRLEPSLREHLDHTLKKLPTSGT